MWEWVKQGDGVSTGRVWKGLLCPPRKIFYFCTWKWCSLAVAGQTGRGIHSSPFPSLPAVFYPLSFSRSSPPYLSFSWVFPYPSLTKQTQNPTIAYGLEVRCRLSSEVRGGPCSHRLPPQHFCHIIASNLSQRHYHYHSVLAL